MEKDDIMSARYMVEDIMFEVRELRDNADGAAKRDFRRAAEELERASNALVTAYGFLAAGLDGEEE